MFCKQTVQNQILHCLMISNKQTPDLNGLIFIFGHLCHRMRYLLVIILQVGPEILNEWHNTPVQCEIRKKEKTRTKICTTFNTKYVKYNYATVET